MPNGNLRIPTAGVSNDGSEKLDGYEEINAEHPSYAKWFEIINRRGPLLEALGDTRTRRKEERRTRLGRKQ